LLAYLEHAGQHYRGPDGSSTDEHRHIKSAIRYVRELYGEIPAADFGPLALKAVRQKFVQQNWCRKTANARVEWVRRVFKWAVAEELIPPTVYQAHAPSRGCSAAGPAPRRVSQSARSMTRWLTRRSRT
jgi:hypothetical protein